MFNLSGPVLATIFLAIGGPSINVAYNIVRRRYDWQK